MQNIPDEGFHGIHLIAFDDIGELDVGVLKRLVSESKSLTQLTVSFMKNKILYNPPLGRRTKVSQRF